MSIRVLFFGAIREIIGERELDLTLMSEIRTREVLFHLIERFPLLKDRKMLYALNQQHSNGDEIVKDGDELAFFTAVSGG